MLNLIFANKTFYLPLCQGWLSKKNRWTSSIVGLCSGLTDQQRFIRSHKSSETRFFPSCPSGRRGHCFLLILAWMTAASRLMLENGTSSVMHSSISIANEYVSECVVAKTVLFSMTSGAAYLTIAADDTVFEIVFSFISSMILDIPKSQICGSPLCNVNLYVEMRKCSLPR